MDLENRVEQIAVFENITMLEFVYAAYHDYLTRWSAEYERKEEGRIKGYETPIADHWLANYSGAIDELHALILELEHAKKAGQNIVCLTIKGAKE